jgi:Protein of unknown function (DUF1552)
MMVTRKSLPRRTFLRGVGTALALPLFDAMVPAFAGPVNHAAKPPLRLGFVYHPTGMIMNQWTPVAEGAAFEITPTMQALAPFRDRILVLSGLAQINGRALGDGAGDHAREGATWLTGVHPKKTEGAGIHAGISADQIAAREMGKHTQLASLELALESPSLAGGCDSGYSCAYTNTVCWRTATTPLPMEISPRVVFERLFGDGDSTDPAARLKLLEQRRSILDYVAGSVDRLETKLGPGDRRKLSEYLEAIRDIERRIQKAEQQNASLRIPVMERPGSVPETFEEHSKLMIDLQVMAFQTDMTRVISFMMGRAGSNRSYPAIGVSDGHHSITHHQNDPVKVGNVAKIDAYLVKTFAYYLERLKATPDGDGNLLDHSMILYGSSLSDANRHTHHDLPICLAGGGAGQLRSGRHVRYPQETPMNNLLLNLLDKVGVPTETLGDSTGKLAYLSDV